MFAVCSDDVAHSTLQAHKGLFIMGMFWNNWSIKLHTLMCCINMTSPTCIVAVLTYNGVFVLVIMLSLISEGSIVRKSIHFH